MAVINIIFHGMAGREVVDSVDVADYPSRKAADKEARRLCSEYAMAGMVCTTSPARA